MKLLKPTRRFESVLKITAEDILSTGADTVLLDADNTLSLHGSQAPYPGVTEWLAKMQEAGIKFIIISNNSKERIVPFAAKFGLPFVYRGNKPLKKGFKFGWEKLGSSREKSLVIGDQLFTDVLGGNLLNIPTFLTDPLGPDYEIQIVIKRKLEKLFL